jgi:hypothetical protein
VLSILSHWRGRLVVAFVLIQLLIPLHYYVLRKDPHDERFAWRMFSPMRMASCRPTFRVDGAPVDLHAEFHEAWVGIAGRGRMQVIEAMGKRLCAIHPGSKVVADLSCTYVDRPAATFGGHDMCGQPEL